MKFNKTKALTAMGVLFIAISTLLLADKPQQSAEQLTLSFNEFDQIVGQEISVTKPLALAELISKQSHSYQLIKVDAKGAYWIPTTEVLPLAQLIDNDWRLNDSIVLYADDMQQAVQGYLLLMIRGYFKVSILEGGLENWNKQVLFPSTDTIPANEIKERQKLSQFFGGKVLDSQQSSSKQIATPMEVIKKKQHHKGC